MISSTDEFIRLRISADPTDVDRAKGESADEAIWLDLLTQEPVTRMWVAENRTVSSNILRMLANDEAFFVRHTLAMHCSLDEETFAVLAGDPDSGVRHQLVYNPNIPRDILRRLSQDRLPHIATDAANLLAASVR